MNEAVHRALPRRILNTHPALLPLREAHAGESNLAVYTHYVA
jgi:folate-dependent phosphoribosylglycinamide formyltransferase PurN